MLQLLLACHVETPTTGTDGPTPTGDDDDDTCASPPCDPTTTCPAPVVDGPTSLTLVIDPTGASWRWRPIRIANEALVSAVGDAEVVDAAGNPIEQIRDGVVYARLTGPAGEIRVDPAPGCEVDATTVDLVGVDMPRVVGTGAAGLEPEWSLARVGDPLGLLLAGFPDREGLPFDAIVVPSGATSGAPVASGVQGDALALGAAPGGAPWSTWDVILDFDADGALGPGDLLHEGLVTFGDLSAPGPHVPRQARQSGPGRWLQQVVYWPEDVATLGQVPLVVVSHGNGHDYTWYDWLGQFLASHGYVVMSHANNTMPGPVAASETTIQNTDVFFPSLANFEGGVLDGHVDPHRIVWIGHSRGGEGIVLAWRDLANGLRTPANFGASDVVLLSSIAPTLFEGPREANPGETPYHLLAGSSDGDVTGGVDQGLLQYFRIFQGARAERFVTYLQGADHNDFNCCGAEDANWWPQNGPLIGRDAAQQISRAYYLALLDGLVGSDRGIAPALHELFARSPHVFAPPGVASPVDTVYEAAVGDSAMLDDFQNDDDAAISSSGGAVTFTGAGQYGTGALADGNGNLSYQVDDPMNGMSWASRGDDLPAKGALVVWTDEASLSFAVPPGGGDVRGMGFVSFRAAQGTRSPLNAGGPTTFGVALTDDDGTVVELAIDAWGAIPTPYARGGLGAGTGWVNEFQTLRLPLSAFVDADPELDLGALAEVAFRFGPAHGSATGQLGLDDVSFAEESR